MMMASEMTWMRSASIQVRVISLAVAISLLAGITAPVFSQEEIFTKWEEIGLLRARGEYKQAVSSLRKILIDYPDDGRIQRRAWNLLVHTMYKMNNEEEALATARQALELYPDLSVNPAILPEWMNETYSELRSSMYGALTVTGPEGAELFLDSDSLGTAPFSIDYLRTGNYSLTAEKNGYHARIDTIRIDPSETLTFGMTLERKKDKKWWLYRVGPVVVAGIIAIIGFTSGSGDDPVVEDPLPDPPDPPAN
ncbi:MAG: PEGA domain-containing protein [Bacteroidales bacterium]|nr:PEGA domain-containing protein [Candidatus Latescibacterota bacterium]